MIETFEDVIGLLYVFATSFPRLSGLGQSGDTLGTRLMFPPIILATNVAPCKKLCKLT